MVCFFFTMDVGSFLRKLFGEPASEGYGRVYKIYTYINEYLIGVLYSSADMTSEGRSVTVSPTNRLYINNIGCYLHKNRIKELLYEVTHSVVSSMFAWPVTYNSLNVRACICPCHG